ncbi:unnamed protein product [Moneuplotes crassus]|uniref:Uncharacterized protein n=2 Tax=Euplotes crassus TaxID=5936 RepID=A0AAD1XB03_EUPCR|nr:unnamed protein product [Moneuplotes crassus]
MSKNVTIAPFQITKKSPSGLKEYIVKSNHPTLKKKFINKTFSKLEKDFNKIEVAEKKEILENIQGIHMQLVTLVEKIVNQERSQIFGKDILETINLNSSALKIEIQKAFTEVSQIFRHLLRSMVKLEPDNNVVVNSLNSIWEIVTYFLDTTLDVNTREVETAIQKIKDEYLQKKQSINDFELKNNKKDEQIKIHLQRLKQENQRIGTVARDREHQLRLLSNPEGIKKYKDLLTGFNSLLQDKSKEKEKQLSAMGEVLSMIEESKLEIPKSNWDPESRSGHRISHRNLEKFMKHQETVSIHSQRNKSPLPRSERDAFTPVSSRNKLSFHKIASERIDNQNQLLDHESEITEDRRLTIEKVNRIAKKSMFRKPDLINDSDTSDNEAEGEGDDNELLSEINTEVQKAMRQADISRFKENLEKRKKEMVEYERRKELTKSMSILECRKDPDINKQITSFALELQILECLRIIKGKGKNREDKEVQTTQYKYLPNDVTVDIDYDNLDDRKEIIAIRQIVLPPRRNSNDSEMDEDEKISKRRKRRKRKKMITKGSVISNSTRSNYGVHSKHTMANEPGSLDPIDDQEFYEYEEEEESESEFEKSDFEPIEEDIQIRPNDDKDTKKRKLREAYFRLAKQASNAADYDIIDKKPENAGPTKNNPLIEILEVDLNLNEKILPMPEGTLYKSVENTLDERLFKEMEWILSGDQNLLNMPLNKFFYDQLLMNYGLKKLAIKNIQSLCQGLISVSKKNYPYASIITRILGFEYPFEKDEIDVVLRSRIIFNEAQTQWRTNCIEKGIRIKDDQLFNIKTGGDCNIFSLLDFLSRVLDKEGGQKIIPKIVPSLLHNSTMLKEVRFKLMVEFSLMKICLKMNKLGKDVKGMFEALDVNNDKVLEPLEMINGLKNRFGIFFSDEEMASMLQFIDADFSGDIDLKEFTTKITMGNSILNKLQHNFAADPKKRNLFIINKADFINSILKEYRIRKMKDLEMIERDFDRLDKKKRGEIGLRHFKKYLNEDHTLTPEKIQEFIEGSDSNFKCTKSEFVEWVFKNGIYGCGKEYLGSYIFSQNYGKLKVVQKKDKYNL